MRTIVESKRLGQLNADPHTRCKLCGTKKLHDTYDVTTDPQVNATQLFPHMLLIVTPKPACARSSAALRLLSQREQVDNNIKRGNWQNLPVTVVPSRSVCTVSPSAKRRRAADLRFFFNFLTTFGTSFFFFRGVLNFGLG